jgi:hypothetical protein
MRNLNKNVLTSIEPINQKLKKCWEHFKNMGTTCTQCRKIGSFLLRNPRVKKVRFVQRSEHTASSLHALHWTHTWCGRNAAFFIQHLLIRVLVHPAPTGFRGSNSAHKYTTTYLTFPLFLLTCNIRPLLRNFHKSYALDFASKFPVRRRRFCI